MGSCLVFRFLMGILFMFLYLTIINGQRDAEPEQMPEPPPPQPQTPLQGYLLTIPQTLQAGSEEQFCLTLHDLAEDQTITLSFSAAEFTMEANYTHVFTNGVGQCNVFRVPSKPGRYRISLFNETSMISKVFEVEIQSKNLITLVQTDKPIYKPGQLVKFRILTLLRNLRSWKGEIESVFIVDPNELRVKQYKNVASDGLASFEFQLISEAKLGNWLIAVTVDGEETQQKFDVAEYVLPRFEVTIQPQSYLLLTTEVTEGYVCAKYTYGKPVKGFLTLNICGRGYGSFEADCAVKYTEIEGCYNYSVNISEIFQSDEYVYGRFFSVKASVREADTGVQVNKTVDGPKLSYDQLKISFSDSNNGYFKPGLPVFGKVKVEKPDGTPAPNEEILVTASDYINNINFKKTYRTDVNGEFVYYICHGLKETTSSLSLYASATAYKNSEGDIPYARRLYQPRGYASLRQWFSPSLSYIKIPARQDRLKCQENFQVNIPYTHTDSMSHTTFYYQAVSRGRIVYSGEKVSPSTSRPLDVLELPVDLCLELYSPGTTPDPSQAPRTPESDITSEEPALSTATAASAGKTDGVDIIFTSVKASEPRAEKADMPEDGAGEGKDLRKKRFVHDYSTEEEAIVRSANLADHVSTVLLDIPISAVMSPKFSLLVFYIRDDGEVVADTMDYNVEPCFENEATMQFSAETVLPGAEVKISLSAAPGSVCSIGVVDKSVNILGGDHQITQETVFKMLDKYSLSRRGHYGYFGSDDSYCREQMEARKKDKEGTDKEDTEGEAPSFGWYMSNYVDAMEAFKVETYTARATHELSMPVTVRVTRVHHVLTNPHHLHDSHAHYTQMGFLVLTNLNLETRPCVQRPPVYFARSESDGIPGMPGPAMAFAGFLLPDVVRTYFPETWLWDLISVGVHRGLGRYSFSGIHPEPVVLMSNSWVTSVQQASPLAVRSFFPETWLWDLQPVGETGRVELTKTVPHTITKWIGNSLCTNEEVGLGVSPVMSLTTFQPFFLSVNLPYAAVRGERLPITITVYNYLDKCLNMVLTVDGMKNFKIHNVRGDRDLFCLCGGQSSTKKFYLTAQNIGKLPLFSQAEVMSGGNCGSDVVIDSQYIGLKDSVQREVLVKAEGVTQQYSHSIYMCVKETEPKVEEMKLPLPDDIVEDSARGEVAVIGDIMGPALTNLDSLVRMPTGCGEQNMVGFTPNIYVLKYLTATSRLTEQIQDKTKFYMETGYQRELKYRHADGSFSAYGDASGKAGSTWLTAFVVQSFAQARPYIYIDERDLEKSISYLRRAQGETGCFVERGQVFSSYMKGGLGQKNNENKEDAQSGTLTAYVLVSLLQAGLSKEDSVTASAIGCIHREVQLNPDIDTYSLALAAYANVLYDQFSNQSLDLMKKLNERAVDEGTVRYWKREGDSPEPVNSWFYYAAPSAEVEMTAYALLATIRFHGAEAVTKGQPIAYWLSSQQSAFGGYSSTQDTVVGLNALSEFAMLTYSEGPTNISLAVEGSGIQRNFEIQPENSLELQTEPMKQMGSGLRVQASGTGCALLQANVRYNKLPSNLGIKNPKFMLTVEPRPYQFNRNRHDRRTLYITFGVRKSEAFTSGMTMLTIHMVTSWSVIPDSLRELSSRFSMLGIDRYEVSEQEGVINFYLDQLDTRTRTLSLDLQQDIELAVSAPKPAEVQIYEYYERDMTVVESYTIKTTYGTKLEIPYDQPEDPSVPFPVQTRISDGGLMAEPNKPSCPVCNFQKIPENYEQIVCNSTAVYKVQSGRRGKFSLKILANLRTHVKQKDIEQLVNLQMEEGCSCPLLLPPVRKVFIMTKSENLLKDTLIVDSNTYVFDQKMDRSLERKARHAQKKCRMN